MATTISAKKSQESKQFKSQKKSKLRSGINPFELQLCQDKTTSSRELLSDWKDAS